MSEDKRVAVVTGSNKGIGLAIVRALCKSFRGHVYLTSRDEGRGKAAVASLEAEGLTPRYHQLDIDDAASVERLRDAMTKLYGGIDVLVNNVGISFKSADTTPFGEQAVVTMATNYHGSRRACDALIPIAKAGARIVMVSSMGSVMSLRKCSPEMQAFFRRGDLTESELTAKMEDFVSHARTGDHQERGYSNSAYGMSKVGMTCLTRIWARKLKDSGKDDIIINACCPGWVRTDMAGPKASKSPDEGAETPVYLALLPPGTTTPYGELVSEKTIKEW